MQKILNGVQQFQRTVFGTKRQLFEQLSRGQQPQALFITCSDSRVDPCLLRKPNRVNCSFCGTLEISSHPTDIRWVQKQQRLSLRSGHCDPPYYRLWSLTVRRDAGLLQPQKTVVARAMREWLEHARATMNAIEAKSLLVADNTSELLVQAVEQNVLVQLANLETHPVVADALSRNEVLLHGWVYEFETGKVTCCQHPNDQFMPLECVTAADSVIE